MGSIKLKELSKLGYKNDVARSVAITTINKHFKHASKEELERMLTAVRAAPYSFLQHETLQQLAATFIEEAKEIEFESHNLLITNKPYTVFGGKGIDQLAKLQMDAAMSLPVAVKGALMPDAHGGYGLPIGGVMATNNVVIPYAVGMDIGCRMALSITDAPAAMFKGYSYQMKQALRQFTHFGMEGGLDFVPDNAIAEDVRFNLTPLLKSLHGKACRQLGTSGKGNHFVEFGIVELEKGNGMQLPAGNYVGLLSHSGSRGLGAAIAMHYTQLAMNKCRLPKMAKSMAWLDMDTEEGMEYWQSMELAGDYAKACHDIIHQSVLKSVGLHTIKHIDNHHNFAWKETLENKEVIIHRKGATPAHIGEMGIIPGSMATPAFIVSGRGKEEALSSASHGAGRTMSRQKIKNSTTMSHLKQLLKNAEVTLIGGSIEESPVAYKNIRQVMKAQEDLVKIEGRFMPKIVRMDKD